MQKQEEKRGKICLEKVEKQSKSMEINHNTREIMTKINYISS